MDQLLRILIVDDSAFVRKVIKQMLSRSPFLDVVGVARDGAEALQMVEELKPDVVTLDLNMPGTDGLSFLRQQMARRPIAVLIVSIASRNGEQVLLALESGAVDVVQKPTALATEKVLEMADELVAKVKAAAGARVDMLKSPPAVKRGPAKPFAPRPTAVDVVVLGISTGGPQALKYLIPQLPADFPVPLLIVLHMPIGFTELYARSLAELSDLQVSEAKEGDMLRPGVALLAPGWIPSKSRTPYRRRHGSHAFGSESAGIGPPPVCGCFVPIRCGGIRRTRFGRCHDGNGFGWNARDPACGIKAQGGRILTEAEESCVVYGMPRAVIEAGLSDRAVPLARMGEALREMV